MIVQTFKRSLTDKIDRESDNFAGTGNDRIQKAFSTAVDIINAPRFEITVMSSYVSSGQNAAIVTLKSETGEHKGLTSAL